MRSEMRIHKIR